MPILDKMAQIRSNLREHGFRHLNVVYPSYHRSEMLQKSTENMLTISFFSISKLLFCCTNTTILGINVLCCRPILKNYIKYHGSILDLHWFPVVCDVVDYHVINLDVTDLHSDNLFHRGRSDTLRIHLCCRLNYKNLVKPV
jgi:hypothetical protein